MKVLVVWSRSKAVSTDVQTHYKLQIFRSKNLNWSRCCYDWTAVL